MGCKATKEVKKEPKEEPAPQPVISESAHFDIFIRDERELDVVLYRLRLKNTDTVAFVKERISQIANVPIEMQVLTFREKKLEDRSTLHQVGLFQDSAIVFKSLV